MEGVPWKRAVISRMGNRVARLMFGIGLRDCTNGFRAVKTSILSRMNLQETGFAVIMEELYNCRFLARTFCEVPVVLTNRQADQRSTSFAYTPATLAKYLKFSLLAFFRYPSSVRERRQDLAMTKRRTCRGCDSGDLLQILDFGPVPLAGGFLSRLDLAGPEPVFPLQVHVCEHCSLVQILDPIDPELLFQDYSFSSSTVKPLVDHFENYARWLVDRFHPAKVVEFGCNDGILLAPSKQPASRRWASMSHRTSLR